MVSIRPTQLKTVPGLKQIYNSSRAPCYCCYREVDSESHLFGLKNKVKTIRKESKAIQ